MVLFTIVLWLHVFSAIGWLGAAMVLAMVIGPGLQKLTPQSRGEFVVTVVPRYIRYSLAFAVLTLIFGIISVAVFTNGDFSMMSPSTTFGAYISAGALLAIVALVVGLGVAIPSANKMVKILKSTPAGTGAPPPELKTASDRMRIGSTVSMALLVIVTILMVAGATL